MGNMIDMAPSFAQLWRRRRLGLRGTFTDPEPSDTAPYATTRHARRKSSSTTAKAVVLPCHD